jgi:arginine:ornithine antiporter/lysine permease
VLYAAWLLYAGGAKYLLLSALLYALGALLYVAGQRAQGKPMLSRAEWPAFVATLVAAGVAAWGLQAGWLSL